MTSFMARFWTGQASDTYGRGIFISGSLVCYLVSMLILSLAKTSDLFLLAAALEGIGAGILIPMTIALISDRSEFHERGKVFSVCVSGFDVGIAIAGPLFGWIGEIIGFRGLFTITSALSLIALILFSNQCNPNLKSSWSFAWGRDRDRYAIKA
ncbi:MAG: MFS transporter, partial [Microcystaceae cyanobacterium]